MRINKKYISHFLFAPSFFCLLLLLVTASVRAEAGLPERFDVTYVLTKGPLTLGEMTRTLTPNGDGTYTYESHSKPTGYARWFTSTTLIEKSKWVYHNNSLRPLGYSYDRSGDEDRERHVKLDFDWTKRRVTNTINNDPWKMDVPENTMDKLLYHLALMHDLQTGRKQLTYSVADGGSLKEYEFEVLGNEKIETNLGTFNTIKLVRPGRRETVLWCAIDYNYVPVRIEQEDKHGLLQMDLTKLSGITRQPK